jgi:hypothetical protein
LNRANLILASDAALGVDASVGNDRSGASFTQGNPSNNFGFNLLSDNDLRTINVDMRLAQNQTIRGSNSLTWTGMVTSSNTRNLINLLPTDTNKQLTISGITYASSGSSTDAAVVNRIFTYDGTGKTVVTGSWHDRILNGTPIDLGANSSLGHFRKTGTGTLLVSDPAGQTDFRGDIFVDHQGVIRLANDAIFDQARYVTSTGGAIGIETGTFTNTTLLQKLNVMWVSPNPNLNHGGLMLTPGEAAAAIDFTSGDLANLPRMSVGHEKCSGHQRRRSSIVRRQQLHGCDANSSQIPYHF